MIFFLRWTYGSEVSPATAGISPRVSWCRQIVCLRQLAFLGKVFLWEN